jgi:hypothetical protein
MSDTLAPVAVVCGIIFPRRKGKKKEKIETHSVDGKAGTTQTLGYLPGNAMQDSGPSLSCIFLFPFLSFFLLLVQM